MGLSPFKCEPADLLCAYRKAKVDVYYERDQDLAHSFCEFETNLAENLAALLGQINRRDWIKNPQILGGIRYAPKSISPEDSSAVANGSTIQTGRIGKWKMLGIKPVVKFRAHCHSSVEWHIISALWIAKIGHRFDALLGPCCYGNRVRRVTPKDTGGLEESGQLGEYHEFGLGSFKAYLPAYKRWRDDGLAVINAHLKAKKSVIAVTADLTNFYHEINATFMVSPEFLAQLPQGLLSHAEEGFHRDVIESIITWSKQGDRKPLGLPVGLGASRVIANAILIEFDRAIQTCVKPLYYGRYVDDVFLVLHDVGVSDTLEAVWRELRNKLNRSCPNMVSIKKESRGTKLKVHIAPSYARENQSTLVFEGSKQKAFFLDPVGGPTLMAAIQSHIRDSSSIWNRLPELSESEELADLCFLAHNSSPSETPDVLRKADVVSIRRSRFAMRLRDLEAVCEDLTPDQWKGIRRVFIETVNREIAETHELFSFAGYLPRVLSLAVASNDLIAASSLVRSVRRGVQHVYRIIRSPGFTVRNSQDPVEDKLAQLKDAQSRLGEQLLGAIAKAWPANLNISKVDANRWEELADKLAKDFGTRRLIWTWNGTQSELLAHAHAALHARDLALRPFRSELLNAGGPDFLNSAPTFADVRTGWWGPLGAKVHLAIKQFLHEMWSHKPRSLPAPLLFPTRPFSFAELTLLGSSRGQGRLYPEQIRRWLQALRGSFGGPEENFGHRLVGEPELDEVHFPTQIPEDVAQNPQGKVIIAVTCFLTEETSFRAAVHQVPEPTSDRYRRATALINAILHLKATDRPHYVVFPELSLRPHWFNRFAVRLARSGISLIAGLDYQRATGSPAGSAGPYQLINQVRCSLVTTAPGYSTPAFYVQNKQEPAPIERAELDAMNRSALSNDRLLRRKIVVHGAWRFGLLICNELTDLAARAVLRGKVDGLIVPEWNKDVNSFNALVEATSLDLPAYVIQVNNRCYGDSRVRQPHQDTWMRDLTQVKGGKLDYFTVVDLDINALRHFQTHAISPDHPFKPMPTGFRIHPARHRIHP
jgi:hypothetical protein